MPLFSLGSTVRITEIPRRRREFFDAHRPLISAADYRVIRDALNTEFNKNQSFNSSHIPGPRWTDGPYAPILDACHGNETAAGWLFGLILWEVAMIREDNWHFYKPESTFDEVTGTLYIPEGSPGTRTT